MKIKFYFIAVFLSGYLFSSDDSTIQTYNVSGVPVQIVERLEAQPDENGIRQDTFVQAEGNEVQEILEQFQDNQDVQNNLRGAELATVEIDRQAGEAYIVINYPNGEARIERFY